MLYPLPQVARSSASNFAQTLPGKFMTSRRDVQESEGIVHRILNVDLKRQRDTCVRSDFGKPGGFAISTLDSGEGGQESIWQADKIRKNRGRSMPSECRKACRYVNQHQEGIDTEYEFHSAAGDWDFCEAVECVAG